MVYEYSLFTETYLQFMQQCAASKIYLKGP